MRRVQWIAVRLELELLAVGRERQLPNAAAVAGPAAERDARERKRPAGYVVVDGRDDRRLEWRSTERGLPQAGPTAEPFLSACCPHGLTIRLLDEICEPAARLLGFPLEAGRIRTRRLEQKLLPSLKIDPPQELVDPFPAECPFVPADHAASRNSGASAPSTCRRAGPRKTATTTKAATSSPPRTTNDVWKPLTVAAALAAETP